MRQAYRHATLQFYHTTASTTVGVFGSIAAKMDTSLSVELKGAVSRAATFSSERIIAASILPFQQGRAVKRTESPSFPPRIAFRNTLITSCQSAQGHIEKNAGQLKRMLTFACTQSAFGRMDGRRSTVDGRRSMF